jgi:hypothetical protein
MTSTRQLHLKQLRGIGERYGNGRLTHEDALTHIHEITNDRDEMAEAIAYFRDRNHDAELLLIAAGADLRAVQRYLRTGSAASPVR